MKTVKCVSNISRDYCLSANITKSINLCYHEGEGLLWIISPKSWAKVTSCITFCLLFIISLKKAVLIRTLHKISTHRADLYHSLRMIMSVLKRHQSLLVQTQHLASYTFSVVSSPVMFDLNFCLIQSFSYLIVKWKTLQAWILYDKGNKLYSYYTAERHKLFCHVFFIKYILKCYKKL